MELQITLYVCGFWAAFFAILMAWAEFKAKPKPIKKDGGVGWLRYVDLQPLEEVNKNKTS